MLIDKLILYIYNIMPNKIPIYYTNSNSCYPNNAIVIGGVNTAAKRKIQRKSLHSCTPIGSKLKHKI